ncbi:hypothetical protein SK128_023036 [Halocaridina rubra]|uniref:Uncharacterized protein n=1 Tax=Halocaridina rubra TaxID=373956 RepID=A0AAN8XKR3_HALRR
MPCISSLKYNHYNAFNASSSPIDEAIARVTQNPAQVLEHRECKYPWERQQQQLVTEKFRLNHKELFSNFYRSYPCVFTRPSVISF